MLQTRELRTTLRRWGTLQSLSFIVHVYSLCVCVSPLKGAAYGQHFLWASHVVHVCIRAKWLARPSPVTSVIEIFPAQTTVTHRDTPRLRPPSSTARGAVPTRQLPKCWRYFDGREAMWTGRLHYAVSRDHGGLHFKFEFLEFFERVRGSQRFDMICRVMILVRFDGCQIRCCQDFA